MTAKFSAHNVSQTIVIPKPGFLQALDPATTLMIAIEGFGSGLYPKGLAQVAPAES
jgi:hypothetical protein